MVHVLSFVMVGLLASALAHQAERSPSTLFLAVVLFAVFGFGFFTVWTILGPPILGALAWWSVATGNGIAALVMGYYLWRRHPRLREQLAARPLGTTDDDTAGGIRAPE
jgi:lipopolysaccharide export LptBFGC system permease protein LptF